MNRTGFSYLMNFLCEQMDLYGNAIIKYLKPHPQTSSGASDPAQSPAPFDVGQ